MKVPATIPALVAALGVEVALAIPVQQEAEQLHDRAPSTDAAPGVDPLDPQPVNDGLNIALDEVKGVVASIASDVDAAVYTLIEVKRETPCEAKNDCGIYTKGPQPTPHSSTSHHPPKPSTTNSDGVTLSLGTCITANCDKVPLKTAAPPAKPERDLPPSLAFPTTLSTVTSEKSEVYSLEPKHKGPEPLPPKLKEPELPAPS